MHESILTPPLPPPPPPRGKVGLPWGLAGVYIIFLAHDPGAFEAFCMSFAPGDRGI